jgi:CHAT domain-containing protein
MALAQTRPAFPGNPTSPIQSTIPENQAESTVLETGKVIEREMAGGQRHYYHVTLSEGQFLKLEIRDHGTDVGVLVRMPSGDNMNPWQPVGESFDVKPVSQVAEVAGIYRIEVYSAARAVTGRYEIRVSDLRPANEDDRALQEARYLFRAYIGLRNQGKWTEGLPVIQRVLAIRERVLGPDSLLVATTLGFVANNYDRLGDYASAEPLVLRALKIKEKLLGPNHPNVALELNQISVTYRTRGDYAKAEELEQRALAILERINMGETATAGAALEGLGWIHYAQQDYRGAETYALRARAIWEKLIGPDQYHLAPSYTFLGNVANDRGDYAQAEKMFQKAFTLSEKAMGADSLNVTVYRNDLARLACTTGDYARGEALYQQSLAFHEQKAAMSDPVVQETLFGLARCYAAQGNVSESVKYQSRASEIEEHFVAVNLAVGSEREKQSFLASLSSRSWRNISLHARLAPDDPAALNLAITTVLQSKGRVQDAMSAGLSGLRQRLGGDDQKLLDRLNEVTSKLASLVLSGQQRLPVSERQQQIKVLDQEREDLEDEINRRSSGFYAASKPVTLAAVEAAVPADTALIEFAVYRPFDASVANDQKAFGKPRYVAYVIRNQGAVRWSDLGEADAIEKSINNLRRALRDPQRKDVRQLARALDALVMEPVRSLAGNVAHLLVSPDGELNLVPFDALVDQKGRFLTENYSITYLTAGRDLLRMQIRRDSKSVPVVIADPLFGEPGVPHVARTGPTKPRLVAAADQKRGTTTGDLAGVYFAPLSGTIQEARAIHALFTDAQVLIGAQATKSALQGVVAPRILHIATHGFFLEDPADRPLPELAKAKSDGTGKTQFRGRIENPLLRSGLALAGANLNRTRGEHGILTALEASSLNLWGTKLVVLSACETGVGEVRDGEGVYGLRRSFFLAGTETLVMSLWSVSDEVTRATMTAYYAGLKQGLGRGEALHRAQLALLKRKDRQHPYYWASFIQSGDWTGLDSRK